MTYADYLNNLNTVVNGVVSLVTSTWTNLMNNPVTGVPILLMAVGMVITILIRLLRGLSGGRREV